MFPPSSHRDPGLPVPWNRYNLSKSTRGSTSYNMHITSNYRCRLVLCVPLQGCQSEVPLSSSTKQMRRRITAAVGRNKLDARVMRLVEHTKAAERSSPVMRAKVFLRLKESEERFFGQQVALRGEI